MKKVFQFEEQRSPGGAAIFYVIFVAIGYVLGIATGWLTLITINLASGDGGSPQFGHFAGALNVIVYTGILTGLVVSGRRLPIAAYLLVPAVLALTFFGSIFAGVIIPAILTTLGPMPEKGEDEELT